MFIRGRWLKYYCIVAAGLIGVFGYASSNPGLLDGVVWPIGYTIAAATTLALGFFPSKQTLRVWAGFVIGTEFLRSLVFAFQGFPNQGAGFAINMIVGMLSYAIWEGFRHQLPERYDPEQLPSAIQKREQQQLLNDSVNVP